MSAKTAAPIRRLTRDEILNLEDRQTEDVEVPEWNTVITVCGMSGIERDQWEASKLRWQRTKKDGLQVDRFDLDNVTSTLVAMTCLNADGSKMFSQADVLILGQRSAAALDRLAKVAQRLSGITDVEVEDIKEDLGKGHSDDSSLA